MRSRFFLPFLLFAFACTLTACASEPDRTADLPADERATPSAAPSEQASVKRIVFLGNSLTAGYGLDAEQAFPALIQQKIDSLGWAFEVIDAGESGRTSAGGVRAVEWLLREPVAVFILELGGNDGLRGLPVDEMRANLAATLDAVRAANPDAELVLAGMQAPPNMGVGYTDAFAAVYTDLAREYDAALIPFLLEGVAADPALNLPDGIHPNPQGHRIVAETVWDVLRPVLEAVREAV